MILDDLKNYAYNCLHDVQIDEYEDYISCQTHKWACQRFLNDIKRSENDDDCWFYWDDEQAKSIVKWFALLRHSKGELAGTPIILNGWQKFVMCQLYGWRRKDTGRRRFKRSFFELARKNSKSQLESGVALYEISVTSTSNHEVAEAYTAGTKREQSKIVFDECKLMLRGSPLQSKFRCTTSSITHVKTGSFIKPLSREDGKNGDGTCPALLVLDEFHQHKTTEFYDLGLGSNTKEPLLMIITTAGKSLNVPCFTVEYQYCKKILNPDVDVSNDEYLIDIMELDKEDYRDMKNIGNERLWHKANPVRCTYNQGVEKIRSEYEIAKEQPEQMPSFLTKCLDVWVQAKKDSYMDMSRWKACECTEYPVNIDNQPVYVGFDLSKRNDLTSVAFIIPYESEEKGADNKPVVHYIVKHHSFIPTWEKLNEHISREKQHYDVWEQLGFITVTETQIVDQTAVMLYVLDECKKHNWSIECFAFDPAGASKIMMDLSNEGYEVEEVWQSPRSLNDATTGFRDAVYAGRVHYLYDPLLNYSMSNAVTKRNQGFIKIDKEVNNDKIDPCDALICGFKLSMYHVFEKSIISNIDAWLESDW